MLFRFLDLVRQATKTYLDACVDKSEVQICPYGNFHVVFKNIPGVSEKSNDLFSHVWLNNVPLLYEMLRCFNVYTFHLKSLSTLDDELYYDGPLRSFKTEGFECLRNASSVLSLFLEKGKTVRCVVSGIRLI